MDEDDKASRRGQPAASVMTAAGPRGGRDKALCGAQRRRADATCRRPAGWGTDHPGVGRCKLHGGSTPSHKANAARKATDTEARAMLARLGEPDPLGDPVEELLRLGAEVRAYQEVLRERIAELREFSKDDVALIDRERAAVRLYGEALDRSHRVLGDLVKFNLDERLVRVRETQAAALVVALCHVLAHADLALDPARQRRARALFAAELVTRTGCSTVATGPDVPSEQAFSGDYLSRSQVLPGRERS